jgi:hypothetical protein
VIGPDSNPWRAGHVDADQPKTKQKSRRGYGFLSFVIAFSVMLLESVSFNMLTSGNRYEHPLGDELSFTLSFVGTFVAIFFSARGSCMASAAIRDPLKNLAIACVVFLLNFLYCIMLSSLMVLFFLSLFE